MDLTMYKCGAGCVGVRPVRQAIPSTPHHIKGAKMIPIVGIRK